MLNFTTKIKTLCLFVISLLFSSAIFADTYPTSDELIGRYHFSGKCSVEAPSIPAVNDYDVVILPAEGDNNFYICGMFGFDHKRRMQHEFQLFEQFVFPYAVITVHAHNNLFTTPGGDRLQKFAANIVRTLPCTVFHSAHCNDGIFIII